jgi:DNA modification methylase
MVAILINPIFIICPFLTLGRFIKIFESISFWWAHHILVSEIKSRYRTEAERSRSQSVKV